MDAVNATFSDDIEFVDTDDELLSALIAEVSGPIVVCPVIDDPGPDIGIEEAVEVQTYLA